MVLNMIFLLCERLLCDPAELKSGAVVATKRPRHRLIPRKNARAMPCAATARGRAAGPLSG
jgi:hypothetical protein